MKKKFLTNSNKKIIPTKRVSLTKLVMVLGIAVGTIMTFLRMH